MSSWRSVNSIGPLNFAQRANSSRDFQVSLPVGWFVGAWTVIVATHTLCGVYMVMIARINWFFMDPNMIYWAKLVGGVERREPIAANTFPAMLNPYFNIAGNVFAAIGSLLFFAVLWILKNSLRERKLVFRQAAKRTTASMIKSFRLRAKQALEGSSWRVVGLIAYAFNTAMRWFWMVFGIDGILGVRSKFFPEVFAVREAIEVAAAIWFLDAGSTTS